MGERLLRELQRRFRNELLDREAQILMERWRRHYGVDCHVIAQNAPVRLSTTVGPTSAEIDDVDEDGLAFEIGAAISFGGPMLGFG